MARKRAIFQVFQGKGDKQWYAHLRAPNGEIVAASEGYSRKGNAVKWCEKLAGWAFDGLADVQGCD